MTDKFNKIELKKLIWYIIIAFPLTSTMKVYVGPLNLIFTILFFILFFYNYYQTSMLTHELLFCFYAILSVVANIVINNFHFYSVNMVFYFPFLILYFLSFLKHQNESIIFMRKHKRYVDTVIILWIIYIWIGELIDNLKLFKLVSCEEIIMYGVIL